jgi:hypothetical protein
MAKNNWKTAKDIARDVTDLPGYWVNRDTERHGGEEHEGGSEGFDGIYEWDILRGAGEEANLNAIIGSTAGKFLGVTGKMLTGGVSFDSSLLKARSVFAALDEGKNR